MMTWRSLICARRALACDLTSLPSEISILGYFQEDTEEYHGVYIMEDISVDVTEGVVDVVDVTEDIVVIIRYPG
jgi:hypothetical protein